MKYVLESNIISYALKGDVEVRRHLDEATATGNEIIVPHIVYFEIKRWLLEIGAKVKRRMFEEMLHDTITIQPINEPVWDMAATLYVQTRKEGKPMGDADLLIAAFCLINDFALVSNNTRHFERIEGLKLVNWKE